MNAVSHRSQPMTAMTQAGAQNRSQGLRDSPVGLLWTGVCRLQVHALLAPALSCQLAVVSLELVAALLAALLVALLAVLAKA